MWGRLRMLDLKPSLKHMALLKLLGVAVPPRGHSAHGPLSESQLGVADRDDTALV